MKNTMTLFYIVILTTSAVSSTNLGSILIFASCVVVGTRSTRYIIKTKIHYSSCQIEDLVETRLRKLCVILRSHCIIYFDKIFDLTAGEYFHFS